MTATLEDAPIQIEVDYTPSDLDWLMTDRSGSIMLRLWGPFAFTLVLAVVLFFSFGDALWSFLGAIGSDPVRVLSEHPEAVAFGFFLVFAGIGVLGFLVYVLGRDLRGSWQATKTLRRPDTVEKPGLIEGLHHGPGIVEIGPEGVTFAREHYYSSIRWEAIEEGFDADGILGVQLISGTRFHYGRPFRTEDRDVFAAALKAREGA